jgi:phage-related protein
MSPKFKPVRWVGTSKREMDALPDDARSVAGHELWEVQQGNAPGDFKPMTSVGPGVYEIRVHTRLEHRLMYVAKHEEAVYVLHVFEKRTRKTAPKDIERARRTLLEVRQWRKAEGRP